MIADDLFQWAEQPRPIEPEPASRVTNADAVRFSRQAQDIHEMLLKGPVSNVEMGARCLNPRARISELRKGGVPIECVRGPNGDGVNFYRIVR